MQAFYYICFQDGEVFSQSVVIQHLLKWIISVCLPHLFIYDYKLNKFTISSRTRYQFSTPHFDSDFWNEYKEPSQYIRQKLSIDYNIPKSKLSLNFSPEIFIK